MLRIRGDRVAIDPIHDPDRIGHIIIPDVAKNRSDQGIVKYAGPECKFLKVGDHVLYGTHIDSFQVRIDDEGSLVVMREGAVMCVLEPSSATVIPGVYFKDHDGDFFGATHEALTEVIARHFQDPGKRTVAITDKRAGINIPDKHPDEAWEQ